MNRRKFITYAAVTTIAWLIGCTPSPKPKETSAVPSAAHEDPNGYWTCTMHPQVHEHEPGKCPICGMPLVLVNKSNKAAKVETESVEVSNDQLKNAQISKYTVGKADLEVKIPSSGRLTSSRQVAFQVYESDSALVKVGLTFFGSPSSYRGQKLKGRITRVDNLVDPSSRTIRVDGTLDSPIQNTTTDSAFHGAIILNLKDQILVPEEAVLHTGTRELVYVFASDNKLEPREVQLGQRGNNQYQILSGLHVREVISSGPNFLIDSEAKLRGL